MLNGAVEAIALSLLGNGGVDACWFAAHADAARLEGIAGGGRGGVPTSHITAGNAATRGNDAGARYGGTGPAVKQQARRPPSAAAGRGA